MLETKSKELSRYTELIPIVLILSAVVFLMVAIITDYNITIARIMAVVIVTELVLAIGYGLIRGIY